MAIKVETAQGTTTFPHRKKQVYVPKKPVIETRRELFRESLKKAIEKGKI